MIFFERLIGFVVLSFIGIGIGWVLCSWGITIFLNAIDKIAIEKARDYRMNMGAHFNEASSWFSEDKAMSALLWEIGSCISNGKNFDLWNMRDTYMKDRIKPREEVKNK